MCASLTFAQAVVSNQIVATGPGGDVRFTLRCRLSLRPVAVAHAHTLILSGVHSRANTVTHAAITGYCWTDHHGTVLGRTARITVGAATIAGVRRITLHVTDSDSAHDRSVVIVGSPSGEAEPPGSSSYRPAEIKLHDGWSVR